MDYPPMKSSNKVFDVVRQFQILRKWKKLPSSSFETNSGSLRRTRSFPLEEKVSAVVSKGCFAVLVGDVQKRFLVPTWSLGHPLFMELLREAEEEFGFQQKGVLRIPCDVFVFEHVLRRMEGKKRGKKLGRREKFRFSDYDFCYDSCSSGLECALSPDCEADASKISSSLFYEHKL